MVRFEVTPPRFISTEQGILATSAAGGVVFGEFMSSLINTASNLTGTAALAAGAATKGILGIIGFSIAKGATGMTEDIAYFSSVGLGASIVLDLINYVWPAGPYGAGSSAGSAVRSTLGMAPPVTAEEISPAGATLEKKSELKETPPIG